MPCERCAHLDETVPIRVPRELTSAIDVVRRNIDSGVLREVRHFADGRSIHQDTPFDELPVSGPWPDVLSYHFVCTTCNTSYELHAETYHGSGGAWKRSRSL